MSDLIINFVPTGMFPVKTQSPHVPISPEEIVADVEKAYRLGITMVHLHARDTLSQEPAWQKNIYEQTIVGIRKFAPDLIICVSDCLRLLLRSQPKRAAARLTLDDLTRVWRDTPPAERVEYGRTVTRVQACIGNIRRAIDSVIA